MSLIKIINLPTIGDNRGSLVAMEAMDKIPFNIKRAYFIFDTQKNVSRGFHAHKDLQQVAVCVAGKCRMTLDNGKKREDVWLDSPNKGIFIDKYIWREMHDFSGDCVLLVLASEHYTDSDYIRSYDQFLRIANQ
jgi:dTDP-4-dehydrorhamnose 3,5-epimerase-like enzyme